MFLEYNFSYCCVGHILKMNNRSIFFDRSRKIIFSTLLTVLPETLDKNQFRNILIVFNCILALMRIIFLRFSAFKFTKHWKYNFLCPNQYVLLSLQMIFFYLFQKCCLIIFFVRLISKYFSWQLKNLFLYDVTQSNVTCNLTDSWVRTQIQQLNLLHLY